MAPSIRIFRSSNYLKISSLYIKTTNNNNPTQPPLLGWRLMKESELRFLDVDKDTVITVVGSYKKSKIEFDNMCYISDFPRLAPTAPRGWQCL